MLLTGIVFAALATVACANLAFQLGMKRENAEIVGLEDWSDPTGAADVKAIVRLSDDQQGVVTLRSREIGAHEVGDDIEVYWRMGWVMRDSPNVAYGSRARIMLGPAVFALVPVAWLVWRLAA